ncbi:hypothetical protein IPV69_12185 [Humisphaera borealis]|uniref:Tagaturonate/fructuronate epimerase n=2 Tax=Humisphaera borealis TaxID=2807512 RepID=A0A7M2X416_9BACT|nr:hypothetical protein IPV69_12185 [Humisphaera borealis]
MAPSFGFGDRTGLATPGHVAALRRAGGSIQPIFAQQSIREMGRTNRTPDGVMNDALAALAATKFFGVHGADADHLKTPQDIERTAAAGFTFFTIDPSAEVDEQADSYAPDVLVSKFSTVGPQIPWITQYQDKSVTLPNGTRISLSEVACKRAAVKYGRAIKLAIDLGKHIAATTAKLGQPHEIELSVDETPQPTTLAEHYIIADQMLKAGLKLVSLAPRFIGELEKGVDYKGEVALFEKSVADHAAIAELLGPYKLSLHSGSDKLSIYAPLARATKGKFHVKTAGTSYLEALRVVARHDERLFRKIIDFSRGRYDTDKATYHVSATLDSAPPQSDVADARKLEQIYLGIWSQTPAGLGFTEPGRQILHCTFGSVLTDPTLKGEVFGVLTGHPATYEEVLSEHFAKHLEALNDGM